MSNNEQQQPGQTEPQVYRGEDGRPHKVDKQEEAARDAEKGAEREKPLPPTGAISPPD
jgi:hypothetical protein